LADSPEYYEKITSGFSSKEEVVLETKKISSKSDTPPADRKEDEPPTFLLTTFLTTKYITQTFDSSFTTQSKVTCSWCDIKDAWVQITKQKDPMIVKLLGRSQKEETISTGYGLSVTCSGAERPIIWGFKEKGDAEKMHALVLRMIELSRCR